MLRETVADSVDPNTPAMMDLASLGGPKDRLLHPPPDGDPGYLDQLTLANGPEPGCRGQGCLQLRMDRDHQGLSSLALPDDQGRAVLIEVQVPGFQGQGFGHPEAGPPLFQHDQPGPGVGGGGDEGVDLGPFKGTPGVQRQLLKAVVGPRTDSDHPGLPGVGAGPVGESGLGALIHTLGAGWEGALPAVTGER